jgi:crossover junction endodeoxyribonuclease RusA
MALVQMTMLGDPIPKGRPRMGPNGHAYTPERTRAAERAAVALFMAAMDSREPSAAPIGLALEFHCATKRHTDGDNLMKLLTDAMNGIVYVDDFQIEEWFCRVIRGVGKANAKSEIMVYELS